MVSFMVKIPGNRPPGHTKEEQPMARHGENIRKRNDGRWEARYPIIDAEKGRKIYQSVYGSTYEEVKKKRANALRAAIKTPEQEKGDTPAPRDRICPQILFS